MSKTVDDAIRIRDNQRRSRARRKDLIKDLQTRVQEYELKGVNATQEMQRAARKVARENENLRSLLARHGILKKEIDAFLRSCEETDCSSEPETQNLSARSPSVSNPYPVHAGPRSFSTQPLGQAYSRDRSARPSPISSRPPVPIVRQPIQTTPTASDYGSTMQCVPRNRNATETQIEATVMARTAEACRKVEAYYASPSKTHSSPPSRSQEGIPAFSHSEGISALTQSQGCCPPPRPQSEVTTEDPDCPTTADCFCPPTTTNFSNTSRPAIGTDEISCETAATIIAQMRGDGDEATARASLGCLPQQVCSIKNSFLMQVLDEG